MEGQGLGVASLPFLLLPPDPAPFRLVKQEAELSPPM